MKTAMQELQRWVDETPPQQRFATLHIKIEELLGKEKQQLIDFHCEVMQIGLEGENSEHKGKHLNIVRHKAEQYYTDKFKTD